MDRIPLRVRLTLAFAVTMALVLAGTGLFLYVRLERSLDGAVDRGLQARAADIAALAEQSDSGLQEARRVTGLDNRFAQVLTTRGTIVDSTPSVASRQLLSARELAAVGGGSSYLTRTLGGEPVRLLALRVHAQDRTLFVVVGASLRPRAQALSDLRRQLLIGGPIALLLASLGGYVLAAAALRPVDAMSERAATISAARPGRRLPVPRGDDEISRLGQRLNDMLGRLERALERERSLVANTSHELRTPLALMKTEIELALAEPASAPELAAALRSAGEETDRLAQLADDLLLLATADSGQLPLRRSRIDARELLETIALRFGNRVANAGRGLEVEAPLDLKLLADRRRLEQTLSSLVENALRHGRGSILLHAVTGVEIVELRVADEGPGFEPSFLPRAFDRFSRAESSQGRAGAGLGLAIVAAVAEAHGGTAVASNIPSGGALVSIVLPVRREPIAPTAPYQRLRCACASLLA